ncbi:hypothetical protein GF325_11345 [Candidatus Bathyarchaeota archaeon]|nr:hypothetical protein [Candidatus Bathyarchaeota archaeon]
MPEQFEFNKELAKIPFLVILGKYDHVLGPRALTYSKEIDDEDFLERVLRDALHTKSKYVILDFGDIYAQGCKMEVEDETARGRKQLYVIILLRDSAQPQIPIIHFKRMEMMFHKIGKELILMDDNDIFTDFINQINKIYLEKKEILPLESLNLQIRSGVNTIQGFCELILEQKQNGKKMSMEDLVFYVEMMLDSCNEITKALDESFS